MASSSNTRKPVSPYWAQKYSTSESGAEGSSSSPVDKPSSKSTASRRKSPTTGTTKKSTTSTGSTKRTVSGRSSASSSKGKKKSTSRKKKGKKGIFPLEIPNWLAWVLVALILGFLLWPRHIPLGEETGDSLPPGIYKVGIDISHHNDPSIEWDSLMVMTDILGRTTTSLKAAKRMIPVSFVFMKATEGVTFRDRNFKNNWKEAGERDLQRGAYHFYRTSRDPSAQAKHFIRTVGDLRYNDLPPVLDIETTHSGFNKAQLNRDLLIWLKEVEAHYGVRPIVYTYESFAKDYLSGEILSDYPIWIAHYGVKTPLRDDWMIWQFTDNGAVYGVRGNVDMNIMR